MLPHVPKQAETKWDGEINPQNLNVEKILCCQNCTNQPKSNVELAYIYPRELPGLPAMELIFQNKEKISSDTFHNCKMHYLYSAQQISLWMKHDPDPIHYNL